MHYRAGEFRTKMQKGNESIIFYYILTNTTNNKQKEGTMRVVIGLERSVLTHFASVDLNQIL